MVGLSSCSIHSSWQCISDRCTAHVPYAWGNILEWLPNSATVEGWVESFLCEAMEAVQVTSLTQQIFWKKADIPIKTSKLAEILSNDWLSDDQIDFILSVICDTQIFPSTKVLGNSLVHCSSVQHKVSQEMLFTGATHLVFPFCHERHWVAVQVNFSEEHSITISDSLHYPRSSMEKHLLLIVKGILQSPSKEWKVLYDVNSPKQSDGSSCGIATVNAIHRLLCPEADVWDPMKPLKERAYYFTQCINSCCQVCTVFCDIFIDKKCFLPR